MTSLSTLGEGPEHFPAGVMQRYAVPGYLRDNE